MTGREPINLTALRHDFELERSVNAFGGVQSRHTESVLALIDAVEAARALHFETLARTAAEANLHGAAQRVRRLREALERFTP